MVAFFSSFALIHFTIGLAVFTGALGEAGPPVPPGFGIMMMGVAGLVIAIGWTSAGLVLLAGRFLAQRKHYTYCLVVAAIECMFTPFGTVLGVFTIVVLMRDSVKDLFCPQGETPFAEGA